MVDPASTKPPFVMVLPPLNVTGALNIGHALMVVIEVFTVNAFTDKDSCRLSTDSHLQVVGCVKCLSCAVEVCTGYLFIRLYLLQFSFISEYFFSIWVGVGAMIFSFEGMTI